MTKPLRFGYTALLVLGSCFLGACSSVNEAATTHWQGTLITSIARYPNDSAVTFQRLELKDGTVLELSSDYPVALPSGAEVVLSGERTGSHLRVTRFEIAPGTDTQAAPAALRAPTTLKNAFLILNPTYTLERARKRLLEDVDSPKNFYRENSWGTWTLEGEAFGPYTVAASGCTDISAIQRLEKAASEAATQAGIKLDEFDNVLIYLNGNEGCSWSGWGDMGHPLSSRNGFKNGRYSLYNRTDGCVVLTQELAHNYGLGHSHFCPAPPYSIPAFENSGKGPGCSGHQEYGDPFTPMASGCGHFNAVEMGEMKFIGGCNIVQVSQNGTFELTPIEEQTTGTQVLRVANGTANSGPQFIYAEYRNKRVSSDTRSNPGIYFHAGPDLITIPNTGNADPERVWASDPILISPTGKAASAPLASGEWKEPSTGITFKVLALGDKAKLELSFPSAGGSPPVCIGDGGGTGGGGTGGSGTGGSAGTSSGGKSGSGGKSTGGTPNTGGTSTTGGQSTGGSSNTGGLGSGGMGGSNGGATSSGGSTSGGKAGTGGVSGTGGGTSTGGAPNGNGDGCGCRVTAGGNQAHSYAWGLGGMLLMLHGLRRKQLAPRKTRRR